jgi:osmotically-inducible protein OsmY
LNGLKSLKDDLALKDAIITELEWAPHVDPTFIRLEVSGGAVTLTGKVSSCEEKRATLQAVERVPGVRAVADDLEVREPGCGFRTDTEIAKDIAYERAWNSLISDDLECEVTQGYVTLRGNVEWDFEAHRAAQIIAAMDGVRAVSNRVTFQKVSDMERRG